ncbi:outer membrane beta-barrel protein [Belliella marina]|uniref:Outer membrane beta-barrel protein n=1 Tax=Belliella marina TaxID=1644146 RepID=A0ABW4VJV4_9BACT
MRYFVFMIFLFVYIPGYGQKVNIGFRSGVSFSNLYSHNAPGEKPSPQIVKNPSGHILSGQDTRQVNSHYYETRFIQDMRIGLFSYIYVDYEITKRLSGEIGLGYTQRGIDIEYSLHSTTVNSDNNTVKSFHQFRREFRLDYISIPITFQYKLDKKERFYVVGGIYSSVAVDFLIKESLVTTNRQTFDPSGNHLGTTEDKSWTTVSYANRFDSGLILGGGINLPLKEKMALALDIRSAVGMRNVPKKYDQYGFQGFRNTAKNIGFETGIKFQYNIN